jgi:hypothetical protein
VHNADSAELTADGPGALVVHTEPEFEDVPVEISVSGDPAAARTRNVVRARHNRHGAQHSAVFAPVSPGHYVVWRDPVTPDGTAVVAGGAITDYHLASRPLTS